MNENFIAFTREFVTQRKSRYFNNKSCFFADKANFSCLSLSIFQTDKLNFEQHYFHQYESFVYGKGLQAYAAKPCPRPQTIRLIISRPRMVFITEKGLSLLNWICGVINQSFHLFTLPK